VVGERGLRVHLIPDQRAQGGPDGLILRVVGRLRSILEVLFDGESNELPERPVGFRQRVHQSREFLAAVLVAQVKAEELGHCVSEVEAHGAVSRPQRDGTVMFGQLFSAFAMGSWPASYRSGRISGKWKVMSLWVFIHPSKPSRTLNIFSYGSSATGGSVSTNRLTVPNRPLASLRNVRVA
jgi:hypothetical protein